MTRKVDLGAPSLTGKDANDLVAKEFAKVKYPFKVVVTNHMPRNAVFPEVEGLHLSHCADEKGRQKEVEIGSEDQFQRLASSIEQIAELNGYELALTISEVDIAVEVDSGATKKPSDGLNGEQLKEALKAKGIEFQNNAKKAELAALLDNAPADDAGAAGGEGSGAGENGAAGGQQDTAA